MLTSVRSFLGNYYADLYESAINGKYKNTGLDNIFEQRFLIQNNKFVMYIDPLIKGYHIYIAGNEIRISESLYKHSSVKIGNSKDKGLININPLDLYLPDTFSTIAYLICGNHTTINIIGELDEPIYVKYQSEYECFYSSVLIFRVEDNLEVDIFEEIESRCALNSVVNYVIGKNATVNLYSIYNNHSVSFSYVYRNVIGLEQSNYNHYLLGKGSEGVLDEHRFYIQSGSKVNLFGCIDSLEKKFNSILTVYPTNIDYSVSAQYRSVVYGNCTVSFRPMIVEYANANAGTIDATSLISTNGKSRPSNKQIAGYMQSVLSQYKLEKLKKSVVYDRLVTKFLKKIEVGT